MELGDLCRDEGVAGEDLPEIRTGGQLGSQAVWT